ncbi:hypothetical protein [Planctomicrobium sp. SH664]|uniref:hypothetical protein n=1 Tax=Planctomicrobium sp. SH664 TaxID=3448125 RepID=UPI003F5B772E
MAEQARENGVAGELQRIEIEFARQRQSLTSGNDSFAVWQATWKARQEAIDAKLAELNRSLTDTGKPPLKIVSRP